MVIIPLMGKKPEIKKEEVAHITLLARESESSRYIIEFSKKAVEKFNSFVEDFLIGGLHQIKEEGYADSYTDKLALSIGYGGLKLNKSNKISNKEYYRTLIDLLKLDERMDNKFVIREIAQEEGNPILFHLMPVTEENYQLIIADRTTMGIEHLDQIALNVADRKELANYYFDLEMSLDKEDDLTEIVNEEVIIDVVKDVEEEIEEEEIKRSMRGFQNSEEKFYNNL